MKKLGCFDIPEMVKQYFFETELVTNWEVGIDIVSFASLGA
ncbi:MAG: hypothetical protein NWS66_12030 [Saprospiraceae bacterium]|nr:hypothetical protein [Saprospiraceae bacterium]MDP4810985.1 hypothetical protein [Saprospiraceae bacterium]